MRVLNKEEVIKVLNNEPVKTLEELECFIGKRYYWKPNKYNGFSEKKLYQIITVSYSSIGWRLNSFPVKKEKGVENDVAFSFDMLKNECEELK